MLKRSITYEDFNGNQTTDVYYFHLSEPELIEMEVEHKQGLGEWIKGVIEAKDHKTLIQLFKEIVLKAYGQKSEDGKRFIKSDELREDFSQTAAYNKLFIELATNDNAAADFIKGILPKNMAGAIDEAIKSVPSISGIPTPNP